MPHAFWFGEDQARYLVTVPAADAGLVLAKMKGAGVPCARIGTTGGDAISIADQIPVLIKTLKTAFEHWLPAYMNGKATVSCAALPAMTITAPSSRRVSCATLPSRPSSVRPSARTRWWP